MFYAEHFEPCEYQTMNLNSMNQLLKSRNVKLLGQNPNKAY